MERPVFNDCFLWLEKYHSKRGALSAEAHEQYFAAFAAEYDEVFIEAVNLSILKLPPGQFPTIERLRKCCTEAREKITERAKAAEPKRLHVAAPPLGDIRNTALGIESLALVQKIAAEGYSAAVMAEIHRLAAYSPAWAKDWSGEIEACATIRQHREGRGSGVEGGKS